ncbi:hypothetical protein CTI12_AA174600 [Artemisia annua]|uniref:Uncharacterized protein n=1 Tax=Artemisia annua TaxID=35608 RepID=A0A2U1PB42_ARTAN|nr:hypothetical protein CTI12_AA174600 [Artemisia annua]
MVYDLFYVSQNQMEEPKECPNEPEMSNNVASPRQQQVKKDIAEKLYQVLSFCESSIIQEIDKCNKDEIRLNSDIMWFSSSDKRREWKKQHIKDLEKDLGKVDHELPMTSVPRTDVGFFPVTKNDTSSYWTGARTPIDIGTDKKRCHNRLNKGRMDLEYSKQVQEEILLSKKSINGAQELNYVRESLVHRFQHGNNKRAEEAKLYHEIRNVNDTIEIYTEPPTVVKNRWQWRPALPKGYKQHQLKIVSNQLEKSCTVRRGQLNLELDLLRRNIKCMEREHEKISSLRKKAYKCAYKHGEQQIAMKSSYTEYQSLMTYVKELARRGDIEELMQVCHRQLAF